MWPWDSMSHFLELPTPSARVSIVAAAHEVCPYSNATRGNVDVTLKANGHSVPTAEPGDS